MTYERVGVYFYRYVRFKCSEKINCNYFNELLTLPKKRSLVFFKNINLNQCIEHQRQNRLLVEHS